MKRMAILAAGCAAIALAPAGEAQARSQYEASITRTTYGIPHIAADSWRGVGYGVAYAYAEDNLCLLAEEFATVAGERSLHFGPEGKLALGFQEVDNLSSDVFFRAALDLPALRAGAKAQSRDVQLLAEGYVAGYNRFLKDAGADGVPAECRGKAWVRPITPDDLLRLTQKQMLLASSLALAPGIANAAPPGRQRSPKWRWASPAPASWAWAAMAGRSAARRRRTGAGCWLAIRISRGTGRTGSGKSTSPAPMAMT